MRKITMILSVLLLFSCSKEELKTTSALSNGNEEVAYSTPDINYHRALSIAEKAPSMFSDAMSKGAVKRILNSEIVSSGSVTKASGADTLMYVFNYAEGGYVVIPMIDIDGPVVAYIEKGRFNIKDTIDDDQLRFLVNLMISSQENLKAKYELQKLETKSIPPIVENIQIGPACPIIGYSHDYGNPVPPPALANKMGDEYYSTYGCWRPSSTTDYVLKTSTGPLLQTRWHQGDPINSKARLIGGQRALSGSVAIALAQIMAYHAHPTNYPTLNISSIARFSGQLTYLASLKDEMYITESSGPGPKDCSSMIASVLGYLLDSNWGLDRTSAYTSAVPNVLYKMGYDQPVIYNFGLTPVRQSVISNQPVYIAEITTTSNGCVHAWVIDGYKTMDWVIRKKVDLFDANGNYNGQRTYPNITGGTYYLHSNFGFGGAYDGFFMESVFDAKPYLTKGAEGPVAPILQIIPHIRKQ